MLDIGWSELLVIGVVALIVVGPKDLPVMFKTLGRFTARARGMAREFQRAMDQAANDSGIKDVAKDLDASSSGINALKDAADKFEKWDPRRAATTAAKSAVAGAATAAVTPAATAEPAPVADPSPAAEAQQDPKAQA